MVRPEMSNRGMRVPRAAGACGCAAVTTSCTRGARHVRGRRAYRSREHGWERYLRPLEFVVVALTSPASRVDGRAVPTRDLPWSDRRRRCEEGGRGGVSGQNETCSIRGARRKRRAPTQSPRWSHRNLAGRLTGRRCGCRLEGAEAIVPQPLEAAAGACHEASLAALAPRQRAGRDVAERLLARDRRVGSAKTVRHREDAADEIARGVHGQRVVRAKRGLPAYQITHGHGDQWRLRATGATRAPYRAAAEGRPSVRRASSRMRTPSIRHPAASMAMVDSNGPAFLGRSCRAIPRVGDRAGDQSATS